MLVTLPAWEMPAEPWTTVPPVGPASAGHCRAISAVRAVVVASKARSARGQSERRGGKGGSAGRSGSIHVEEKATHFSRMGIEAFHIAAFHTVTFIIYGHLLRRQ